jgi:hypothetical protein
MSFNPCLYNNFGNIPHQGSFIANVSKALRDKRAKILSTTSQDLTYNRLLTRKITPYLLKVIRGATCFKVIFIKSV